MTWQSHVAIASAIAMPFNPALIPVASLGATAPDWIESILSFIGHKVPHRGVTHYVYIPILIIIFSLVVYDFNNIIFWFGVGYLSHWIADSLTPSGVPISQFNKYRVHIFGGKIKTGSVLEYILAFGLLIFMVNVINPINILQNKNNFNPYYMDYKKLYNDKIIDQKTYREHRFKLF